MSTKAELEQEIAALKAHIVDLQQEVRERDEFVRQAQQTVEDAQEAYSEATGMVGDLLVSNRLLQRRLKTQAADPPPHAHDAPSLTAKEAQDLGLT